MERKRILIVDDDEGIQEMLSVGLGAYGYEVLVASDEKTFREQLSKGTPDAILMDVSIPGMDGISLCREIKYTPGFSNVPVLMITAYSDKKAAHDAYLFGADGYLIKPFDITVIKEKLEKAIERCKK
ncbi:MAG: response regulator [Elusimicrobiota bacterium]